MKKYFKRLYNKTASSFYSLIKKNLKNEQKQFIVTANPETFMKAEQDEILNKMLLDENTTIVPDGIGIVKAAKILNYDIKERIPGIDIATKLLEYGNEEKKSIYLFGAQEAVIVSLKEVLVKNYPNLKILGAKNGYEKDRDKIFKDIIKKEPDIVLVALGIPEQEKLIYKYLDKFKKGILVGVGGSFDVISGHKKRAPKLFQKLNLEWLYRILKEPKRIKRFYDSNIKFLFKINKLKKEKLTKKEKISKYLTKFFFVCYFIFSLYWLLICFNYNSVRFLKYILVIFLILGILFLVFKKMKIRINYKLLIIVSIIISILLRVFLLSFNYVKPTNDYATFFYNSIHLANNDMNLLNKQYISAFPYLYGYMWVLSNFFKLFGNSYSIMIILNIILDLLGALFIYLFTKKLNKKIAIYALIIWLFNPFEIYFCSMCSPVIIVNTFFSLSLYMLELFLSSLNNLKMTCIYGILLGISLAVTNVFRPIMVILIIALFIYLIYLYFNNEKANIKNIIIGFLLVFITYQFGNLLYFKSVSKITDYKITKSLPGWSIYVGSNTLADGQWSELNSDMFSKYYYDENYTPEKFSDALKKHGIERYKTNGFFNNINLMIRKSKIFSATSNEYLYNSFFSIIHSNNRIIKQFIMKFTNLFWYLLIIFNFVFSIKLLKSNNYKKLIPYCLLIIGIYTSSLIVEVSARYFFPMFTPLCLMLSISLYNISRRLKK